MDWKHILSLSPDNLSEDEKEQMYGTIAWFDIDGEKLDQRKYIALLKICQEVMKYKAEQVEALLAELDEIAVRQGEEEAQKQDDDLQSIKSKRSQTSVDYDDLEKKYRDLKSKLKQQNKTNEHLKRDIVKLKESISMLDQEKLHLQSELQSVLSQGDESRSDISETITDQHKELVRTVQQKNRQISQLLNDIETMEKENVSLREKMSNLRDELRDATSQLSTMTAEFTSLKVKLSEKSETINNLKEENEAFRSQIQEFVDEKQQRDDQIDEFTAAIDTRVDEWKNILHEKEEEIKKLNNHLQQTSLHSSQTTISVHSDKSYVEVLNKVITEREEQLSNLQTQIQDATKEMEISAQHIKQLTTDKNTALSKIDELSKLVKSLKTQLQAGHERSQVLQEEIEYAESVAESKQEDLNHIMSKLKSEGKIELSESLEEIQKLKAQVRVKNKQISEYVKISNKLQNSVDHIENENSMLRDKCGISNDEDIDVTGVILKRRKHGKELEKLQKQILIVEDEKLNLKGEIQQLNRKLSVLSQQIFELGEKPIYESKQMTETDDSQTHMKHERPPDNREQYSVLLEENEALRKGLHEILESVQLKNESSRKEIKSQTLEKLLHSLDVRHVSGWYHPAMRIQAELHTLQGVNSELRDQLKAARSELNSYHQLQKSQHFIGVGDSKESDAILLKDIPQTASAKEMISSLNSHLLNILNNYHEKEGVNSKLLQKLEEFKTNFEIAEKQLNLLYNDYMSEKSLWKTVEDNYIKTKTQLEEEVAVLNAKIKEFSNRDEDEFKKAERFAEMSGNMVILNRKCVFLENEESRLSLELKKLQNDIANAEVATFEHISKLRDEKDDLLEKLLVLEKLSANNVDRRTFIDAQNNLDCVTLKYRESLRNFNSIKAEHSKELLILTETVKMLEKQNSELQDKLLNAVTDSHIQESIGVTNNVEVLSKKLAQSEVSEIAEKQRANHMSNLYGLVKEQLQKSEERSQNLEKYNQEILGNNLILQENIKNLEDKLINYVDVNVFKDLELKFTKSSEEMEKLVSENNKIKKEIKITKKAVTSQTTAIASNNLEVLSLKHQILDLQASGDDKALIARLSSDVVLARLSETQCQKKIEDLEIELSECQHNCEACKIMLQQEKLEKENSTTQLLHKIGVLEHIIHSQRNRYLGSMPLISEEIFSASVQRMLEDKQAAFSSLQIIHQQNHDSKLLKEQLDKQVKLVDDLKLNLESKTGDVLEKINAWHQERNIILIKELKYRREVEFKNMQIEQLSCRLNSQDELITKLEKELLQCYHKYDPLPITNSRDAFNVFVDKQGKAEKNVIQYEEPNVFLKQQETQTSPELHKPLSEEGNVALLLKNLQTKLNSSVDEISEKNNIIEQLKTKITELEMNVSLFRTQIGDKQSQIIFYEKHILEIQSKLSKLYDEPHATEFTNTVQTNPDEMVILKEALKKLQETNVHKDGIVLKYQMLLKRDRDEHSLAAARMQQEMKRLQEIITSQEKAYKELKETSVQHPGRAAIEQYILQVHALEKHTADLHTTVSTLNSQLQASRQETSRWQSLANARLDSMEQLRTDLEEQHQNEIAVYKRDSERWREEILKLKEIISKHRKDIHQIEPDFNKILQEKNEKINELNVTLKQVKMEVKKQPEKSDSLISPKVTELESANEQLLKDYESLKRRYEQVLMRERNAKDEIHNLKEQLLKKPISARSDKSDKEERLQKRIRMLEKEVEDLKDKLDKQSVIHDAHRVAVSEDFEKWKRQKYWQQTAEKFKNKLQEKSEEYDKLNQTCAGYRILIERLEREKHNLENKIKVLRNHSNVTDINRSEFLHLENERLHYEIQSLTSKLQTQHRHSGGLGATMLQEKLEAQERKIAVLDIASKGTGELRIELERLQNTIENLQKINLRLEAENLDLKLDLERYGKDAPHLREQIQHLENYIEVLKSENQNRHTTSESGSQEPQKPDQKKIGELERTVFVLKRVVEKLQVENKRLQGGSRPCTATDRSTSADKIRLDYQRLKEQYGESVQQVGRLEDQLKTANNKITLLEKQPLSMETTALSQELTRVRAELSHKAHLLDKIKVLLHRAATKEKALLEEISALKAIIPPEVQSPEANSQ